MTVTPIIQFGTSRFLQAHADLFISDARAEGQDVGPITVVQTSGAASRAGRLAAFDGRPIPIVVRGLENGKAIDRTEYTRSIVRGLSAAADWPEVERIFVEEAKLAISNTAEVGYDMPEGETIGESVPASFPAKLTKLLHARFHRTGEPIAIFPGELITQNGTVLKGICIGLAERSGLAPAFREWLTEKVLWANTLVDRIVSAPIEPVGAVAEPYALWAIETQPGLVMPAVHRCIRPVSELATTERLKLFILNLGHTCLAERWLVDRRPEEETVREILAVADIRAWLDGIYDGEVLPVFAAAGIAEAPEYRRTVMERFLNPFLDHRLREIAGNHLAKKERRIGGLSKLAAEAAPGLRMPTLAAIAASGVSVRG
ncbi:MAG: mannitol dehydrogenase family protein [Rhizobiales bacterium]|nr:mannitol dehydrogenase family protein [Hyphomicrobiales bacterium]MBN9010840.1 mannitol dehydrogenase family protein [Hyphomicrobiales bacterium]